MEVSLWPKMFALAHAGPPSRAALQEEVPIELPGKLPFSSGCGLVYDHEKSLSSWRGTRVQRVHGVQNLGCSEVMADSRGTSGDLGGRYE